MIRTRKEEGSAKVWREVRILLALDHVSSHLRRDFTKRIRCLLLAEYQQSIRRRSQRAEYVGRPKITRLTYSLLYYF